MDRFAYITHIAVESPIREINYLGSEKSDYIKLTPIVRFSGEALYTEGVIKRLDDLLNNIIKSPNHDKHWICLYCASPNPVESTKGMLITHCSQCGAQRSFIA